MAENFDHIAAAHARNAAMAGPTDHVAGVHAGNKNPVVGEPQGPRFTSDREKNLAQRAVTAVHNRVAAEDRGAMEGIRRAARLSPKKK